MTKLRSAAADGSVQPEKTDAGVDTALTAGKKSGGLAAHIMREYVEGTRLDGAIKKVDALAQFMISGRGMLSENEAVAAASRPIRVGLWASLLLFGVFGLWAAFAPLSSAAVAGGTLVLEHYTKTIQHLEGGIVGEILVKEGEKVEAAQPLIRLSDTTAKARAGLITGQLYAAKAAEARLIAERDETDQLTFDPELLEKKTDPEVAKIMDAQERLFVSRRDSFQGEIRVLEQRVKQHRDEISGLEAQLKSMDDQLLLVKEETATVQKLVENGQAVRPRLLALQRKIAELEGSRGEYSARIARARQSIAETEIEMINLGNKWQSDVMTQLRETQTQIADLAERQRAAQDVLDRTVIAAPQSGIVSDLKFHTVGGVIPPGAEIVKIVPQDEKLVIEAAVSPQDIDVVHAGLPARIRLSAYSSRRVPVVEGTVLSISADRLVDKNSGRAYYLARIEVNAEEMKELAKTVKLYPGMPADVLIVTGERTMLSYLLDPITAAFDKSFREQ